MNIPNIKNTKKDTDRKPTSFTISLIQVTCDTVCERAEESADRERLQDDSSDFLVGWRKLVPNLSCFKLCVQNMIF